MTHNPNDSYDEQLLAMWADDGGFCPDAVVAQKDDRQSEDGVTDITQPIDVTPSEIAHF